jgi:hypothetical protein
MRLQKYANIPNPEALTDSVISSLIFCNRLCARDLTKQEEEIFLEALFFGNRCYNPIFEEFYSPYDIELLKTRLKIEKGEKVSEVDTWIDKGTLESLKTQKLLEFSKFNPKQFTNKTTEYLLNFFSVNYSAIELKFYEIDLLQAYKHFKREISASDLVKGVNPQVSKEIVVEEAEKGRKILHTINLEDFTKFRELKRCCYVLQICVEDQILSAVLKKGALTLIS